MTYINEDWEREAQKDFVYLLEQKMMMKEEYRQWMTKENNRKPALINVTDKDKILEKNEQLKHHILPF
jgi:hypothetical protein